MHSFEKDKAYWFCPNDVRFLGLTQWLLHSPQNKPGHETVRKNISYLLTEHIYSVASFWPDTQINSIQAKKKKMVPLSDPPLLWWVSPPHVGVDAGSNVRFRFGCLPSLQYITGRQSQSRDVCGAAGLEVYFWRGAHYWPHTRFSAQCSTWGCWVGQQVIACSVIKPGRFQQRSWEIDNWIIKIELQAGLRASGHVCVGHTYLKKTKKKTNCVELVSELHINNNLPT